ncbi:uncharacterized protein [Phaseolus vulgaris]|uniref:uncharacterized protein n=1 Tax=Phaseolus vulgaris TaxID=3885 RepID=UPI0035CA26EA
METPFSLVYGSDAMIPVEIHENSPRFLGFVAEESNEERKVNLYLKDEAREEAKIKAEAVKRIVERQYSSKVKLRQFQVGDLVMRKAHRYELENKLSLKWTGPFRVTKAKGNAPRSRSPRRLAASQEPTSPPGACSTWSGTGHAQFGEG